MEASANAIEAKARDALKSGEYDAASALFEQALELGAEDPDKIRALLTAIKTDEIEMMGLRLFVPRDVVNPAILLHLANGTFEVGERMAATKDIRPDDRVLELGAGLGTVTLALCLLHPDTPVTTVEADPRLVDILRRNVAQNNGKVDIISAVAAMEDGEIDFHIAPDFVMSSAVKAGKNAKTMRLPKADVQRLVHETNPSVLIMDIEGAEIDILNRLDLSPLRRIVVEFHPTITSAEVITDTILHLVAEGFVLNLAHSAGHVIAFDRRSDAPK